jgi:hypothetical protein
MGRSIIEFNIFIKLKRYTSYLDHLRLVASKMVVMVSSCIQHEYLKLFSSRNPANSTETACIAYLNLLGDTLHKVKLIADVYFCQQLIFSLECHSL